MWLFVPLQGAIGKFLATIPYYPFQIGSSLSASNINYNLLQKTDAMQQLKKLQEFNISANRLSEIPKEFGELSSLTFLMIEHNNFETIPEEICEIQSLVRLHLYKNKISSFPEKIAELKNLRELSFDDNRLTEIQIEKLRNLLINCKIYPGTQNQPWNKE